MFNKALRMSNKTVPLTTSTQNGEIWFAIRLGLSHLEVFMLDEYEGFDEFEWI